MEGFAFCGPFDDFLRRIGPEWLASVWRELATCLRAHDVDPDVLTWGGWHSAYSSASADVDDDSPLGVFGWAVAADRRLECGERIERDLRRAGVPVTLATGDIRTSVCLRVVRGVEAVRIAPGDVATGLELIVDQCDDAASWSPSMYNPWIRADHTCGRIARAVASRDNSAFVAGLEEARTVYTPTGYRIVALGFADVILGWLADDCEALEPRGGWPPVVVELGERLTVTFRPDAFRRPGWVTMGLDFDGADGRWEPVHLENVAACLDALRRHDAPARLTSLAHASDVLFEAGSARGHLTAGPDARVVNFSVPVAAGARAVLTAAMEHLVGSG